jgi:polyhydroxybutyrate depolymerase
MIKKNLLLSFALLLPWSSAAYGLGSDIVLDLGRGPVIVHVPASYDPAIPTPFLLLLHPYSGGGQQIGNYLGIGPVAESLGFIYMHPKGTTNGFGQKFWNATDACCDFENSSVDDSGYLRDLLDAAKAQLNVDPARVHVAGHSNGGFMSYRMACDHSESIASIASLAGATHFNPADCAPAMPLHVLQIHGTSDGTIGYNGGNIGGSQYPSAFESVTQWVNFGGCDLVSTMGAPINLVGNIAGPETTVERFESNCSSRASGELWSMVGAGHTPSLSGAFTTQLMDWFYAHPKPTPGTNYCMANDHSGGRKASIVATGSASIAEQDLQLIGYGAPAGIPAIFIASQQQAQTVFGDGFLCLGGPIQRIQPASVTTQGGEAYRSLDFTAGYAALFTPGSQVNFQLWFRDTAGGGAGFNTSDGCSVALLP